MSWEEFGQLCARLVARIDGPVDAIVGIVRSGLIPAVYLSFHLECVHFGVVVVKHSRSGKEDFRLPHDGAELVGILPPTTRPRSVLVVDDVNSRGGLFAFLDEELRRTYDHIDEVRFATIFADVKQIRRHAHASVLDRCAYAEDIDNDKTWIVWPWNLVTDGTGT